MGHYLAKSVAAVKTQMLRLSNSYVTAELHVVAT
jgi:hypothetical protein